jgi:dTMP kinase
VVINADQDPDEVETAIWAALQERLPQMTEQAVRSPDAA